MFLAKVSLAGALLYSTFLGGSGTEVGLGITLDAAGNVYLTGHASSADFRRSPVTSIRQDEPLSRARTPDASGVGTDTPRVRAARAGGGDGRVYHVSFTATDILGLSCAGTVTVCVPHDRRHGAMCGDGGPLVDSVQP